MSVTSVSLQMEEDPRAVDQANRDLGDRNVGTDYPFTYCAQVVLRGADCLSGASMDLTGDELLVAAMS